VAIVTVGSLLAVNLLVFAALAQDTSTARDERPEAIEQLEPGEGAQAPPQATIIVDLVDNSRALLYINGTLVPEDEYEGDVTLGQLIYRPGEDQTFEELPEGTNNLAIEYWSGTKTYDDALAAGEVFTYSWQVHVGF
jgi:hypothetical protein